LETYNGQSHFFADLHNHCNISYAHGPLEAALANARQRLDICSVTGHAHWPDMPSRDGKIDHIIDFHVEGFAKLERGWKEDLEVMQAHDREEEFIVFPGYEIHSMDAGDYTLLTSGFDAEILYPRSIAELRDLLEREPALRERLLPFPHHIGYKNGRRGINWERFSGEVFPLVEIYSMHGCAEEDENDHPFLHTMGPGTGYGTVRHGLGPMRKKFGLLGNTDHHSAHPGSYGHGFSGIWAPDLKRQSIWNALYRRRTYALSADKMELQFAVNGAPMGAEAALRRQQEIEFYLRAGGPLDYVDVIRNGRLFSRFSQLDVPSRMQSAAAEGAGADGAAAGELRTVIYLEVGWGERGKPFQWDVQLGLEQGRILQVDARFRGDEVVSPLDAAEEPSSYFRSSWRYADERTVAFTTATSGNPTNSTPATQGVALEAELPSDAVVRCRVNGMEYRVPVADLLRESFAAYTGGFDSPAFKLHRAPRPEEFIWNGVITDETAEPAYYYLRGRQKSGAWVWSSPVWVG
jgi:hypothetical protein